jgi:membrane-bound serine protease (ClpP class)
VLSVLLLLLCLAAPLWGQAEKTGRNVYVIPVSADVEPALAAFIERCLLETRDDDKALLVLEMDTYGGRVDSALAIVDALLAAEPRETVAFVRSKAISAGALIALACNRLAMAPNTTIGDCAPIAFTDQGPTMLGEKFQSPLRAKFRTLARRNNYPAILAEAMVTDGMEVFRVELDEKVLYLEASEYNDLTPAEKERVVGKKTVVRKGELLTMDNEEALALGFSTLTAASVEEMLAGLGVADYTLIRMEQTWSESLGRFITAIAPLLMMAGLAALYMELKAPGFGVFGIIGLLCIGLVFFNQHLVGLASHTEFLIVLLGLVLLAMEIFVLPGFGIAGIAGIVVLGVGLVLSFQDFVLPDPGQPWQREIMLDNVSMVLASAVFAFLAVLFFLRYLFPRLGRVVEGPYLAATLAASHDIAPQSLKVRAGSRGVALTPLRPAGKMKSGQAIIDVVTEGGFIDKGDPLVVLELRGNIVVVERERQ